MKVDNSEVARIFDEVADLLEVSGASYFRVRAYRMASRMIRDLSTPLYAITSDPNQKLDDLPGIGKDLAGRIEEILETGDLSLRIDLEERLPVGLLEVMKVPGLGPRRTHELFLELGIEDLDSLFEAARNREIRELKGFGAKTERNILAGISTIERFGRRMLRSEAQVLAASITEHMSGLKGLEQMVVAGSYRRLLETVGDLDILVTCEDSSTAMKRFVSFPGVEEAIARGPTKASVIVDPGLQVDLRTVADESFGSALQYFTGSQAHNVALRSMALRKGLKLNEYGVFEGSNRIAGRTEEEVYDAIGLPWIPPELRENRGEIRLAFEGLLPEPVELKDVRGDLHAHTDASDGRDNLADMAGAAKRKKYLYIAVTDHTHRTASGLSGPDLMEQWRAVEELNSRIRGIHVLKGVEVDVLQDGSLDMPNDVLSQAEYVIAAVHYDMRMNRAQMTRRLVTAISNPLVDALAHPTGRRINQRKPYPVNLDDVLIAAGRAGVFLELNAAPDRLDLNDINCRKARDHGVKISIATDAHSTSGLDSMRYGVDQARKGWLEKEDVINTLTYRSLKKALRERKA